MRFTAAHRPQESELDFIFTLSADELVFLHDRVDFVKMLILGGAPVSEVPVSQRLLHLSECAIWIESKEHE